MVKICAVESGSLAAKKRILAGDVLLEINGNKIADVLDYRFYLTDKRIVLRLLRGEKEYKVKIKKGE